MPKQIILVRHGQTDYNVRRIIQGHLDIPLNATGHAQAHQLVKSLESFHIHACYSSDLVRAKATANYLAIARRLPVRLSTKVREHHLGRIQGWCYDDATDPRQVLWKKLEKSMRDPNNSNWNGFQGESIRDFRLRISDFLVDLHREHLGQNVAVFTHGGTIRRFLEVTGLVSYGAAEKAGNTEVIVLNRHGRKFRLDRAIDWD